jgi:hypothetical protein
MSGAWRDATALEPQFEFEALTRRSFCADEIMPPKKSRESLEHDRKVLLDALSDCEGGQMDHLDHSECANVAERLKQRIAELDAKIAALNGA